MISTTGRSQSHFIFLVLFHDKCITCDLNHKDIRNLKKQDNGSYFTEKYYQKNENAPTKCCRAGCEHAFNPSAYKVSIRKPVWVCKNAEHRDHECTFALCKDCVPSEAGTPTKRPRKKNPKFG